MPVCLRCLVAFAGVRALGPRCERLSAVSQQCRKVFVEKKEKGNEWKDIKRTREREEEGKAEEGV